MRVQKFDISRKLVLGVSATIFVSVSTHPALAICTNIVPTTTCDGLAITNSAIQEYPIAYNITSYSEPGINVAYNVNLNGLSIGTGVTVFGVSGVVWGYSSATTFSNGGTIMSSPSITYGIGVELRNSQIGQFLNYGQITAPYGVSANSSSTINIFYNAPAANVTGNSFHGFNNAGKINNFYNEGQITTNDATGNYHGINNTGIVSNLSNRGTIQSLSNAGTISQLVNYGVVSSTNGAGLTNTGTITSIFNSSLNGFYGSTYGINNSGTIGTIANSQTGLTYNGTLPTNYNIFVTNTSRFGTMTVSNPGSSVTTFGIARGSILARQYLYTNVLTGITSANLAVTSGIYGGGFSATPWTLVNSSGSAWDLQTGNVTTVSPVVTGSQSGTALAQTIASASNGGANPTLVSGVSLAAAVQGATANDVQQLINAHAEGYSSNMTILMERMAGISNAVMDRIHGTGTTRTANMQADQAEKDKFMWAEVSGTRGFVDNYSNLAGFGYNIADLMAGFDIYRGEKGGLGVYVGGGTSRMIESNQVRQTFNSTNGYAGLYGATFLPQELRLSGSLGYMHSSTNAQRIVPDIGAFTGGNAQDTYTSDGAFGAIKLSRPIAVYGRIILTPFIGQTYSRLWVGKINEAGGGDFNFSINASTGQSAVSFVGVDFVLPVTEATKDPLSVIGVARYGHDWFANTNSAHEVVAQSPIYGAFTQIGANMGPNGLQLGLGLQGGITDSISLRAGVVGQINTHGREIGAGGRLRVLF